MTRRALVLKLLWDAGDTGVTTEEFLRAGAGSRFGARIQELRDQGHDIPQPVRVRTGAYLYKLIREEMPETKPAPEKTQVEVGLGLFSMPSTSANAIGGDWEAA